MSENPILFSGPMVRAILDGRKTQTRRIVGGSSGAYNKHGVGTMFKCKQGNPGDRLWVRETHYWDRYEKFPRFKPGDFPMDFYYRADGECCTQIPECGCATEGKPKWRPSIHMPRWASRITLEITNVRVERLQDISAKDILAEGAVSRSHEDRLFGKSPISAFDGKLYADLKSLWAAGWEKINGKGSWDLNPWVWAIEFKRL